MRCCGTTGMEDAVEADEALLVLLGGEEFDEAVLAEPLAWLAAFAFLLLPLLLLVPVLLISSWQRWPILRLIQRWQGRPIQSIRLGDLIWKGGSESALPSSQVICDLLQ